MAQAAEQAGVSLARWSHIENGRETRQGSVRPVKAKADTLARMARAVGVTPERLEAEGRRPDAAEILREILRTDAPPRPAVPAIRPAPPPADDPLATEAARVLFPGDPAKQVIWSIPGLSEAKRTRLIAALDEPEPEPDWNERGDSLAGGPALQFRREGSHG